MRADIGTITATVRRVVRRALGIARVPNRSADPISVGDDPAELIPDLYAGDGIRLAQCAWRFGHIYNDQALVFLCHLAARGAAPIVEFGTFDGRTTYNLALNVPHGEIVTIDANVPVDASNVERRAYGPFVPGERFLDAAPAVRDRIRFLRADSRAVDLSPWYGRAGLVIVDGGHSHEVCANDTRLALSLIRPGGVIVWDDYTPYWPGVKDTLDELSTRIRLTHFPRLGVVVHVCER